MGGGASVVTDGERAASIGMGRAVAHRLLGPGATRGEAALTVGAAGSAAVLVPWLAARGGVEWTTLQWTMAVLLAADLVGGVAANASAPVRRHFFRAGRTDAHHLGFVALHLVHVAVFGWLFAAGGWQPAAGIAAVLGCAAVSIRTVPAHLRRPVAMLWLVAGTVGWQSFGSAPGMDWFVPVLFLKLLVCYLLGDLPAAPAGSPSGR